MVSCPRAFSVFRSVIVFIYTYTYGIHNHASHHSRNYLRSSLSSFRAILAAKYCTPCVVVIEWHAVWIGEERHAVQCISGVYSPPYTLGAVRQTDRAIIYN